jgi:hypothetical protein
MFRKAAITRMVRDFKLLSQYTAENITYSSTRTGGGLLVAQAKIVSCLSKQITMQRAKNGDLFGKDCYN